MDGVQRILVLSFTAWMRNVSRGREAPEEWASLLLFIFRMVALIALLSEATGLFLAAEAAPGGAEVVNNAGTHAPFPALPRPEPAMDKNSPEYQAAKGFEIHFMQEMMRNMRKSVPNEEMKNNNGFQIFQGMLDDQYAENASRSQGIGIAEMIVKQLHEMQGQVRPRRPVPLRALNKSDVIRK